MPQIQILDRHMVTLAERQKAEKLFEEKKSPAKPKRLDSPQKQSQKGSVASLQKGSQASLPQKKKKPLDPRFKGFSKGEVDLYKEVEELKS